MNCWIILLLLFCCNGNGMTGCGCGCNNGNNRREKDCRCRDSRRNTESCKDTRPFLSFQGQETCGCESPQNNE